MEKEFIDVKDYNLATEIRKELKKLGIKPKYEGVTEFRYFTKEELASITTLKLVDASYSDISALEYCTGLKSLTIASRLAKNINTDYSSDAYFTYKLNRSNIKDYSVIGKLKTLQYLSINDEENLESLDLTGLTELGTLSLQRNRNLKEVKGLETLTGLTDLILLNNAGMSHFDLKKMVANGLYDIYLDFDLYPMVRESWPTIASDLVSNQEFAGVTCKWSENVSKLCYNTISVLRMEKMYQKSLEILDEIIGPNYSEIEKIAAIYLYAIQFVKYDYESLDAAKNGVDNEAMRKAKEDLSEFTSNILLRRQSSYNAILEGKSVCEGYSNMIHYLLKMVTINSLSVSCNSEANKEIVGRDSDHSVLKVNYEGDDYYFDATWDARFSYGPFFKMENFFRTKEEFSTNHTLSMTEQDVKIPVKKPFTDAELKEIFDKVMVDRVTGKNKKYNEIRRRALNKEGKDVKILLGEVNEALSDLKGEYAAIEKRIENIIQQNGMASNPNYRHQLNLSIKQRDDLRAVIDFLMNEQKKYVCALNEVMEDKRKVVISRVEQLLDIHITEFADSVDDSNLFYGIPQITLKDTFVLRTEEGIINKALEEKYYDGEIDLKTYQEMKMAIRSLYDSYAKAAPKPDINELDSGFKM